MEPWADDDNTQNAGRAIAAERDAALAEVTRLRRLVTALTAMPGEHRDEYLAFIEDHPEHYGPNTPGFATMVRDTCDVLGHKLRDAVRDAVKSPCPTCDSPVRAIRLIPSPKDSDYSGGTYNDPDYDPKFSNPCTDPWHDNTPEQS